MKKWFSQFCVKELDWPAQSLDCISAQHLRDELNSPLSPNISVGPHWCSCGWSVLFAPRKSLQPVPTSGEQNGTRRAEAVIAAHGFGMRCSVITYECNIWVSIYLGPYCILSQMENWRSELLVSYFSSYKSKMFKCDFKFFMKIYEHHVNDSMALVILHWDK